jgi:hypothetical protein
LGYSLSVLALQCADPDGALSTLDIVRSGEKAEYASAPLTGIAMPDGWYIIVADRCEHRLVEAATLERISGKYRIIACAIEEHVMFSSAEEWREGKQVWRAQHQGDDGIINLETSGTLPASFQAMENDFRARQTAEGGDDAGVDYYFEIPLTAAQAITGFKHDTQLPGVDYDEFDLLRDTAAPTLKPWWKFW